MKVLVNSIDEEAEGIACFELIHPQGKHLPAFSAGSHIDVHVAGGLVRQYSLCNSPKERGRYVIAVQKERSGRGGSVAMHDTVRPGMLLEIGEPRNLFPLALNEGGSLLLAGGIGITPILSMAEQLADLSRPFELHYYTREPGRTAFTRQLASGHLVSHTHMHHVGAQETREHIAGLLGQPDFGVHVYVCGPTPMIDAVLSMAAGCGWPAGRVHCERFSTAPVASPSDQIFHVKVASTGQIIAVQAGQSVLEALELAGVDVMSSCRQGTCGTCLTGVLSGVPDHRDAFLSDSEKLRNDCFTPCCSRSKSDELMLDL